ncbi:MAG: HEAT repeat domain-containing protein, partial [Planctomycetes bacterium]|nr:HEAT repeat domain-containing protein [Planctomycetota bacterium]
LQGLSRLETLFLSSTNVTDAGLKCLQGLSRLETLDLSHTKVTDAGLKHLYPLKRLKYVGLMGTAITRKGAMSLQRAIPGIKIDRDATLADLEDNNPRLRIEAITNIREDRSAEVLAALIRALEDRHHEVQGGAAAALGYVGHVDPTAAVQALIALLDRSLSSPDTAVPTQSERHQVIADATRSLGSLGNKLGNHKPLRSQVVSKLVSLLHFPSRPVRGAAVRALRSLDPQAAVGPLIAALDSEDADLLDHLPSMFSVLGRHHFRAAIPELLKREKDARPEVQAAVKRLLRDLDPHGRERRRLNELGQEGT